MRERSLRVRSMLEQFRPIPADARILEVGSGAHGLVFFFGLERRVGVDPLAASYSTLFPHWQSVTPTAAAAGERLPFRSGSFDVVLCDNVVDHALDPEAIIREIGRLLKPGGLLYFTVNVHHPIYSMASAMYGVWAALGARFEITPFADHTVHLSVPAARDLFRGSPLRALRAVLDMTAAQAPAAHARNAAGLLKRVFFKNARYEIVAISDGPAA